MFENNQINVQEKREKEKAVREVLRVQEEQEREQQRFLALSDREKRALAAERRILALAG